MRSELLANLNLFTSQELRLVLASQVAEYRNKPLLNLGFILSLAIATSTLLSILLLNDASKRQYQDANSQLTSPVAFHIISNHGDKVSKSDFVSLRKQGFRQITPVLIFQKKLANGQYLSFRAIDMLALSIADPQRFNSQALLLTKAHLDSLLLTKGKDQDIDSEAKGGLVLANNLSIPFQLAPVEQWGDVALLDIALAWQLFPDLHDFSYLMVAPLSAQQKHLLEQALPAHLSLFEPWSLQERQGFADALHLNLSAMAILGFMVSLFIAFQAANQAWYKRAELAAQLRLLGVQLVTIKIALLLESLFLVFIATVLGVLIAVALVSVLLPLLGLTLKQLYSLNNSGHFTWQWLYLLWAFAISLFALLLALIKQFKMISTTHIALSASVVTVRFARAKSLMLAIILLLLFAFWPNDNWSQIMFKYALLLMASVALLPNFVQCLLLLFTHLVRSFRFKYILKDAIKQVARRILPIAAFYLALTSSIAAALMVNSFEIAFVNYLNQQLSAHMFIRYQQGQQQSIALWLDKQRAVEQYILSEHTWAKVAEQSVKVATYQSAKQLDSLLFKSSAKTIVDGCYINEQLALNRKLSVAQSIIISQGSKQYRCQIQGIYYEYGYPGFSVSLPKLPAKRVFTAWIDGGFKVLFKPGSALTKQQILTALGLQDNQVFLPKQVKALALAIFSQTFVLTQAIAAVLLAIACLGLALSANSLELARKADLYILCSLGYSKIELFMHMLLQWLLLAFCAILLSWPVAAILANALVSQVLPASFGWSMPLMLNIAPFAISSVLGLLLLIPVLSIPLYKLNLRASLCH